jgi:hypothetical protein
MADVTNAFLRNGNIRFVKQVNEIEPTTEKNGNVTTNYSGQPGVPGHFETSFMIRIEMEENGIQFNNVFHWNDIVLSDKDAVPYRDIETIAARNLAPTLRAAADLIEQAVAEYDSRKT